MDDSPTDKPNNKKRKSKNKNMSIYLKILLNYLQMISIMQGFQLKWPFYVRNYLNFFSSVGGGISAQAISVDCLMEDYQLDVVALYAQTLVISILPFFVYLVTLSILAFFYYKTKKSQNIRLVVVVIVVSIFMQPTILKMLFQNLQCKNIENDSYLIQDMQISCNESSHLSWVVFFVIPFILFWALAYPMICILYLFQNRKRLNMIHIKAKVSFYINGYREKYFFW